MVVSRARSMGPVFRGHQIGWGNPAVSNVWFRCRTTSLEAPDEVELGELADDVIGVGMAVPGYEDALDA